MDRREVERWFIRRGVPHFISGYDAGRDVFTRSVPTLVVAYLVGGFTALDIHRWSLARNIAVGCGIVAVLVATWVLTNIARHRRAFGWPTEIGRAELTVFVVAPVLPSLVFGQQWGDALEAVLIGAGVLVAIYVATSYALVPIIRWALGRLLGLLAALGNLVVRALPLLLLLIMFSFLGAEVWEMAANVPVVVYPAVLGIFVLAGAGFLASRLPSELGSVGRFESWHDVAELLAGTPAAEWTCGDEAVLPAAAGGLSRREWLNVALVALFTQGVQITLVALSMGVFLTVFGALAISEQTTATWAHVEQATVWLRLGTGGRDLVLTKELLQVAGFLATFTGFYFTVYLVTDESYRREFRDDVVAELRQALAVRAAYRYVVGAAAT